MILGGKSVYGWRTSRGRRKEAGGCECSGESAILANFRRVRDSYFHFNLCQARCVCICFPTGSRCFSKTPMCLTSCGHKTCPRLRFQSAFWRTLQDDLSQYRKIQTVSQSFTFWQCVFSRRFPSDDYSLQIISTCLQKGFEGLIIMRSFLLKDNDTIMH